ncbi:MAG: DoxX family protein [Dehalococcoidia bacterium]
MISSNTNAVVHAPTAGASCSRWSLPLLRVAMGLFLLMWGVDKLVAVDGAQQIFERFYLLSAGPTIVRIAGVAEILVALLLMAGMLRRPVAWVVLVANAVSAIASWRQIVDPWGVLGLTRGGTHLFLASIIILAVSVVLVIDADVPHRPSRGPVPL